MKPIFKEEQLFLEERLGFKLPNECWRDGNSIYLNCDKNTLIINFKVEHKQIVVKKNKLDEVLKEYKNKSWKDEVKDNKERLDSLLEESILNTVECMMSNPSSEFRVSDSTGKDSLLCMYVFQKANELLDNYYEYVLDFFNTTNDTPDTYKQIKKNIKEIVKKQLVNESMTDEEFEDRVKEKMKEWVHNPEMGWYQWIKEVKNYYLPSILVRNCCSTYKEGKLKKLLDKKKNYVLFLGMRKYESSKRAEYDWYLNDAMERLYKETGKDKYKLNVPKNWIRFLPIVEWKDEDVWLFILKEQLEFNPMYYKGFSRVGCLICPYSSDYNDLLIEYWYPKYWERWTNNIVNKNYEIWGVEKRLKWTKQEYIQEGKWKQSTSKLYDYITKKPTDERVTEVSNILGVSKDLAKKYFKQQCKCGKRLNPDEIAMYLKTFGRYENKEDDRQYLCKNCLCEYLNITKDEYTEKVKEYRNNGCNLF